MSVQSRLFAAQEYVQPSDDNPIRSVVVGTLQSEIVVWHVQPGQEIAPHIHPYGQDTWIVLSGCADYLLGHGQMSRIKTHDIVIAEPGQIHGAKTVGLEPLVFVSVVAPSNAGYLVAEK